MAVANGDQEFTRIDLQREQDQVRTTQATHQLSANMEAASNRVSVRSGRNTDSPQSDNIEFHFLAFSQQVHRRLSIAARQIAAERDKHVQTKSLRLTQTRRAALRISAKEQCRSHAYMLYLRERFHRFALARLEFKAKQKL